MELKPITRQEQIIAGKGLEPITRMEKFLKEYGGGSGGSSGPADWNAMLNKPFYEEDDGTIHHLDPKYIKDMYYSETGVAEIFPEQSVTTTNHECVLPTAVVLVDGNSYTVVWNGVEYTCSAFADANVGCVALGNPAGLGGEDNGVPFTFAYLPAQGVTMLVADDGTYTIRVRGVVETVFPIDRKYIPSGVTATVDAGTGTATVNMTYEEITAAFLSGTLTARISVAGLFTVSADIVAYPTQGYISFNGYVPNTATSGGKEIINGLTLYQVAVMSDNTATFKEWANGFA